MGFLKFYLLFSLLVSHSLILNAQALDKVEELPKSKTLLGRDFKSGFGINALTLFKHKNHHYQHEDHGDHGGHSGHEGFSLQELEFHFSSEVDAYLRANVALGLHSEEGGGSHSHNVKLDIEEVIFETLFIPSVTLYFGKMNTRFGKMNFVHTHALPFITRSFLQQSMFGEEALSEVGVGLSFLAPLPWFSEVFFQAFQPTNEVVFHESERGLAYSLKFKNFWDLSSSTTIEWGQSALYFQHDQGHSFLWGSDLTLKWQRFVNGKPRELVLSSEFISKNLKAMDHEKSYGLNNWARYQFLEKWFLQAQYEFVNSKEDSILETQQTYSALLAFKLSEYTLLRLQFDHETHSDGDSGQSILLQANISLGSHPAHEY